jgi:hypothetical protein
VKDDSQKTVFTERIRLAVLFVFFLLAGSYSYWGWHLLHGFHTEVRGVRIWVPYSYHPSSVFDGERVVALTAWHGLFSTPRDEVRNGSILIGFVGPNQETVPLMIGPHPQEPYMEIGERKLTMAGRSGECKEYEFNLASSKNSLADKDTRTIYCWFGTDLRASFLGGPAAQGKFYEVIRSAQLVGEKR